MTEFQYDLSYYKTIFFLNLIKFEKDGTDLYVCAILLGLTVHAWALDT